MITCHYQRYTEAQARDAWASATPESWLGRDLVARMRFEVPVRDTAPAWAVAANAEAADARAAEATRAEEEVRKDPLLSPFEWGDEGAYIDYMQGRR